MFFNVNLHFVPFAPPQHFSIPPNFKILEITLSVLFAQTAYPPETSLHIALRLGQLEAIKLLLESSSLDVIKCDSFQRQQVQYVVIHSQLYDVITC